MCAVIHLYIDTFICTVVHLYIDTFIHLQICTQELMGQVLDNLCTQKNLKWNSARSGDEVFVTLSRPGVLVAMAPSVGPFSNAFKRQPGTIASTCSFSLNMHLFVLFQHARPLATCSDIHPCCALDVVVTVEARGKTFVVCHLQSGGSDATNRVSVYV